MFAVKSGWTYVLRRRGRRRAILSSSSSAVDGAVRAGCRRSHVHERHRPFFSGVVRTAIGLTASRRCR